MRYSPLHGVVSCRSRETVRSMRGSAAAVSGIESSHRRCRHSISASTKRVLRCNTGTPRPSVTARAVASRSKARSGVCSARIKIGRVGIIAIRF